MEESKNLSYYLNWINRMKVDKSKGNAPNKPVLLLSIIDLFEKGILVDECIEITPELVSVFRENWNKLVEETRARKFSLPFFHLRTSPFWELIPNRGYEMAISSIPSVGSLSKLKEIANGARIDRELAALLVDKTGRDVLQQFILDKFFKETQAAYLQAKDDLYQQIELNIEPNLYKERILKLREIVDQNEFQEEVFVRSGAFKRMILQNYNDTCAVSGLKITSTRSISMLDACHIVPFSKSYDDTPTNGIALTPTLHRAFDRGLLSISDDYKVILNKDFIEEENSPYRLRQFEGKKIIRPYELKDCPSRNNLIHHRKAFGFQ